MTKSKMKLCSFPLPTLQWLIAHFVYALSIETDHYFFSTSNLVLKVLGMRTERQPYNPCILTHILKEARLSILRLWTQNTVPTLDSTI